MPDREFPKPPPRPDWPPRTWPHPDGCTCCECRPAREEPWRKGLEEAEKKEQDTAANGGKR